MTSFRSSLLLVAIAIVLAACGDTTTPPAADAGGASDMNVPVDGNVPDGASPDDAAAVPDGNMPDSASPDDAAVPDADVADDAGVNGDACGGRAGPCGPTLYCDFTAPFDCGFADGMGTCMPRPDICSSLFAPVCGCDGTTYSNLCVAHSSGVDSAADGACTPPPGDCRTTGCAPGSYCAECRGIGGAIWVCLSDGSVC